MEAVKGRRSHATRIHTPAYDPQSNGAIECAVDHVMGQTRAIKIRLEFRLKSKVNPKWEVMEWIVEHARTLINK